MRQSIGPVLRVAMRRNGVAAARPGVPLSIGVAVVTPPTSTRVAKYKTDYLKRISDQAKVTLFAVYGNATTDIEAHGPRAYPSGTSSIGASSGSLDNHGHDHS